MLSFIEWLRTRTIIGVTDKEKEVLDEIVKYEDFPQTVRKYIILDYLDNKKFGKRKINIVDTYYYEYLKYINLACDPDKSQ